MYSAESSEASESELPDHTCAHIECFTSTVFLWMQMHDIPPLECLGLLEVVKLRLLDSLEEGDEDETEEEDK